GHHRHLRLHGPTARKPDRPPAVSPSRPIRDGAAHGRGPRGTATFTRGTPESGLCADRPAPVHGIPGPGPEPRADPHLNGLSRRDEDGILLRLFRPATGAGFSSDVGATLFHPDVGADLVPSRCRGNPVWLPYMRADT